MQEYKSTRCKGDQHSQCWFEKIFRISVMANLSLYPCLRPISDSYASLDTQVTHVFLVDWNGLCFD
jgi:hypothetical protein